MARSLPPRIVHAVIEFISGPLADNPHRLGKPLRDDLAGLHSARRGDYRILFRIDDPNQTIVVVVGIDHRAHVYRT
ncbi:type II toxin-antitoxin system RelE family toxin [Rhodococcus opacus]|uniref:type II toxin-antitoxin system RelE family toxin n=1 Tax=Rhodococcus opacus TaxID=37919 RepID=UPI0009B5B28B|nr:type II toxin-antitoxin system RelE/ParE family toxin [Rhodococcus opacus]